MACAGDRYRSAWGVWPSKANRAILTGATSGSQDSEGARTTRLRPIHLIGLGPPEPDATRSPIRSLSISSSLSGVAIRVPERKQLVHLKGVILEESQPVSLGSALAV